MKGVVNQEKQLVLQSLHAMDTGIKQLLASTGVPVRKIDEKTVIRRMEGGWGGGGRNGRSKYSTNK